MKNYALKVRHNGEHVYLRKNGLILKTGINEIIELKELYPASIIVRFRKRRNKKANVIFKIGSDKNRRTQRNAFELR